MEENNIEKQGEMAQKTPFVKEKKRWGTVEIKGIDQKTLENIRTAIMIILIITMIVLAFVIYKYGSAAMIDPCQACRDMGNICMRLIK